MAQNYVCSNCTRSFSLTDKADGRAGNCPWCNSTLTRSSSKRNPSFEVGFWLAIGFMLLVGLLLVPCAFSANPDGNLREDLTLLKAHNVMKAIEAYQRKTGGYPRSLDVLVTGTDEKLPLLEGGGSSIEDAWGNPFRFEIPTGPNESGGVIVWTTTPEGERLQWPRE